jgi:hypothetical protein
MKFNPWIIPGLAILGLGGWIGTQKQSSATLEKEITVITERIRQVRSGDGADMQAYQKEQLALKAKEKAIDWKDIAGKMGEMSTGAMPDMRAMMRMQRLMLDLSAEELCAHLDEIATLDIESSARHQLEGMILGSLVEKDPKLALDRAAASMGDEDSGMHWQLGHALRSWADKNPAAATAWLDQQIAAGKFEAKSLDGKNQTLIQLESSLMGALLKTDPTAATARVKAVPESQREEIFNHGFSFQLSKDSESNYAKLLRDTMPADRVGSILADTASTLVMQGNFERVDGFISNAKATDEEKQAIVKEVMDNRINRGNLKAADLDKIREWGSRQAPSVVDEATGSAIASSLWRGGDFKKASELALQYNESSPNDEVLAAFLKSNQVRNQAAGEAKALIDKIKDPALQAEIRDLPQYKK